MSTFPSGVSFRPDPAARENPLVQRIAVILPGAGSSADFVARAFGPALRAAGYELVAPAPVPGPGLVRDAVRALDDAAAACGPALRLVGGVSLGAHLAARWAAARTPGGRTPAGRTPAGRTPAGRTPGDPTCAGRGGVAGPRPAGLLLALPAWTGPPGPVAAATGAAAEVVDRLGTDGALAAAGTAVPWVAAELAAAWPGYGDRLAASLRAAAAAPGPSRAELASLRVPAGLVAFADDPLHPYGVAQEWAATVPSAALRTLHLADLAADPAVLGTAALAALSEASGPA
jgi:pimeloyl-ACP methyl ester carboxylesterase